MGNAGLWSVITRGAVTLNETNPRSVLFPSVKSSTTSDVFEGGAARSLERRPNDNHSCLGSPTPTDQRIIELESDLNSAYRVNAIQTDELAMAEREIDAKDQEIASLQKQLASAKAQLGISSSNMPLCSDRNSVSALAERQQGVIDVLDKLVQEGNTGLFNVYEVVSPIKDLLDAGHSVILSEKNENGKALTGLVATLDQYAETYETSLSAVRGKLAKPQKY